MTPTSFVPAALRPSAPLLAAHVSCTHAPGAHDHHPGTDAVGGKQGEIRTEVLPNGLRMIIAERPGASSVKLQVGVGSGSLQDPKGKLGLAHFLEHLAFEGTPANSRREKADGRVRMGKMWNAYTDRDSIVYFGVVPNRDVRAGERMLGDMITNPAMSKGMLDQERAAVKNEMIFGDSSLASSLWHVEEQLLAGTKPQTNGVIGSRSSVDAITPDDLKRYFTANFTGRNMVALVEGDPKHIAVPELRRALGTLEAGGRVDNGDSMTEFVEGPAVQVVREPAQDSVDLAIMVPIDAELLDAQPVGMVESLEYGATNQLFEGIRALGRLSYGAGASIEPMWSVDGSVLAFRTSVAKDSVREATAILARIARDAEDGFGAKTFARDKRGVASWIRSMDPSGPSDDVSGRAEAAFQGALLAPGVEVPPADEGMTKRQIATLASAVQGLRYERFQKGADALVDFDDVKVLAFGDTDLATVTAGLKDGGLDPSKWAKNPVSLAEYRDQGIRVPKQR